jgi:hypothetical protein
MKLDRSYTSVCTGSALLPADHALSDGAVLPAATIAVVVAFSWPRVGIHRRASGQKRNSLAAHSVTRHALRFPSDTHLNSRVRSSQVLRDDRLDGTGGAVHNRRLCSRSAL